MNMNSNILEPNVKKKCFFFIYKILMDDKRKKIIFRQKKIVTRFGTALNFHKIPPDLLSNIKFIHRARTRHPSL